MAAYVNTYQVPGSLLRPMTMETPYSKVIFPNYLYSKKKPAEDTLVQPLLCMGKTGKKGLFF